MKKIITLLVLAVFSCQLIAATTLKDQKQTANSRSDREWPSQKKLMSNSLRSGDFSVYSPGEKLRSHIPVKSTSILKQRLDSIIHEYATPWKAMTLYNDAKTLFYYDANQIETHEIIYSYDISQSIWELSYRTDFTYNANGQPVSFIDSDWDINLLQWVPGYKVEFTYDANGNILTESEFYMYAPSTVWEPDRIYEYVWDVTNQLLKETEKYWNEDSLAYINQYKSDYTYSNGSLDNMKVSAWNESQSFWVYQNKHQCTYNMSMQLVELDDFGWNESTNQWDLNYKTIYSYNSSAYLVMEEGSEYYNFSWNFSYKTEYQYDVLGNKIESDNYYYNSFDSLWEENYRDYVDYDLNYTINDLILPTSWGWFGEESYNIITEMYGEMWTSGSWEDQYDDNFYYTTVNVLGIADQGITSVKVFPNPALEVLFVQWDSQESVMKFELFDLSGRKVISQYIGNHAKLDVDFLGQGFYFYTLSNDHSLLTSGKISIL